MTATGPAPGRGWLLARLVLPLLALAPLLLFLHRAVTIDDPLYLRAAAQIARDPWRPYGGTINWFGWEEPIWNAVKNPPGVSYWLAVVGGLLGGGEVGWHLSLLPFAVAAVLAGARLAVRFTDGSPWVTTLWVASPAFLGSAATLMADVPSLALSLWGLVAWVDGVDRDSRCGRLVGAGLAGLGVVVKYTAVLGVVTLALYVLLARRAALEMPEEGPAREGPAVRPGDSQRSAVALLADLWPALLAPGAWTALTLVTDGRAHMLDSLALGGGGLDPNPSWFLHRGVALLTFVAATGVFPVLFVVAAARARGWWRLGASVALGAAAAAVTPLVWHPRGLPAGIIPTVGVLAALGACALLSPMREAVRSVAARGEGAPDEPGREPGADVHGAFRHDRDARFLAAWLGLHVAFLWVWSWSVAARFVLPLLVPLALLLARALGARAGGVQGRPVEEIATRDDAAGRRGLGWLVTGTAAALLLSVIVLRADSQAGDLHRRFVPALAKRARAEGRRAVFVGAWGFQHYAERAGLSRVDVRRPALAPGDLVFQPFYAGNSQMPAGLSVEQFGALPGPPPPLRVHTMNINVGAGFHSSAYGPVPYFLSSRPAEGVIVWRVRER